MFPGGYYVCLVCQVSFRQADWAWSELEEFCLKLRPFFHLPRRLIAWSLLTIQFTSHHELIRDFPNISHYPECGYTWLCPLLCLCRGGGSLMIPSPWTISSGGMRWFLIQPVASLCALYSGSARIWLIAFVVLSWKSKEKERKKEWTDKGQLSGICGINSVETRCGFLHEIE